MVFINTKQFHKQLEFKTHKKTSMYFYIIRYLLNHLKMWLWNILNKVNYDAPVPGKMQQMLL